MYTNGNRSSHWNRRITAQRELQIQIRHKQYYRKEETYARQKTNYAEVSKTVKKMVKRPRRPGKCWYFIDTKGDSFSLLSYADVDNVDIAGRSLRQAENFNASVTSPLIPLTGCPGFCISGFHGHKQEWQWNQEKDSFSQKVLFRTFQALPKSEII